MFNIRNEKGMGYIQVVLIMVLIILLVASGIYFVRVNLNERYIETIKTNMLLIQWKIKNYTGTKTVSGEETTNIGTKVSEMKDDAIVSKILEENVINNDEYEKYYVLKDSDLALLGTEITNEEDSYYIVNYETNEIIITKGCSYKNGEILYKLSDINNVKNSDKQEEPNTKNEVINESEE